MLFRSFVQLDGLYVEGLVHITELGGEYFRFDEVRQELRGERSGVRYTVGSRVRVQVSRVDLDGRKIDFRMVADGDEDALLARARRDKFGPASEAQGAVGELAEVKRADRAVKAGAKGRAGAAKTARGTGRPMPRTGAPGKLARRR